MFTGMTMRRILFSVGLALLIATPALAEWQTHTYADAFNGDSYYSYVTQGNIFSAAEAGFSCTAGQSEPTLIYVPDGRKPNDDDTKYLKTNPKMSLVVIVDNDPRVEVPASWDIISNSYRFMGNGPNVLALFNRALAAKKRFGIAIKIDDSIQSQNTYEVEGLAVALQFAETNCKLKLEQEKSDKAPSPNTAEAH